MFYTVSVTHIINTSESFNDFMILIISFISSFEINEVYLTHALIAPFPLIVHSNLFTAYEAKLRSNPGKLSLAKGIARSVSASPP